MTEKNVFCLGSAPAKTTKCVGMLSMVPVGDKNYVI